MIPYGAIQTTIASGTSQSNEVDLKDCKFFALEMPAAWDAAAITLLAASQSGGTFKPVYDDTGTEVSITASAGQIISLDAIALKIAPLEFIKLRSGTDATPVNQTANRIINILYKE